MTTHGWIKGYYDAEAGTYDESRGGVERARAAAAAIAELAPGPGRCLDVAGGTGVVSAELVRLGWTATVMDLSAGMLAVAAQRHPGRVVRASADRLPVRAAAVDLVTVIWMFNLVSPRIVDAVLGEAARVLEPGGHLVCTVDKELAHTDNPLTLTDGDARVTAAAADRGLDRVGSSTFTGRSPWGSATDDDPVFRLAGFRRRA